MPYNSTRRTRERRLRAHYRKKIWTIAIIMLVIGLLAGFIGCVYFARTNDRVANILQLSAEKDSGFVTPTPKPLATEVPADENVVAAPTLEVVLKPVATPTAEPTAEPIVIMTPEEIFNASEEAAAASYGEADHMEPEADELPIATFVPEDLVIPEVTAAVTVEPTVEPTAEPTPEPIDEPIIVAYGDAYSFQTQIKADGSARRAADADPFETLNLTLKVNAYKDPAYFEANYADSYNLQGNEAAVEFDLTLNGYTGSTEIIPQNFLLITFCGEDDTVTSQGFQLMDTEIAGKTDVAITSDTAATLYKRYPYNADQGDMVYMVVTTYNEGVETVYWFEILAPEGAAPTAAPAAAETGAESAAPTGTTLTVGSKGEDVRKLQAVLIELGLLSGEPDGHFGNYTAGAVKEMQRRYGMEQTGIADQAFLDRLYQ